MEAVTAVALDTAAVSSETARPKGPQKLDRATLRISHLLDFSVGVSSRETCIAPDRDAQGNAPETIVATPFVMEGKAVTVEVAENGNCQEIIFDAKTIRQEPDIEDSRSAAPDFSSRAGVTVGWPGSGPLKATPSTTWDAVAKVIAIERVEDDADDGREGQ